MVKYTVKSGETLWGIAQSQLGSGARWKELGYGGDPTKLQIGTILEIPTTATPYTPGYQPYAQPKTPTVQPVSQAVPKLATQPTTSSANLGIPLSSTTAGTTSATVIPQAQVTTQPPIITTSETPKVGVSQIDAGKSAIQELTTMGVSSDINTIRSNWAKFGLDTKLGSWIGSTVQWNAYAKYAKDELERISAGIKEVQQKTTALQEQVAKEGVTGVGGEAIIPPSGGEGAGAGAEAGVSTGTSQPLTPETIDSIIEKIASGEISTPELEISKETTELAKESEKARVASALSQTQQALAKQGMTFSSIRSDAEARIQAEHLSNMAGISLKLASAIIQTARDEQARTAPKYQAVGGSLYEIIPGQEPKKIIEGEPSAPTIIGTAETGYFQWNPQTGTWESTGIQVTGRAPEVIGSAQTGYFQWDSTKQTWVSAGIGGTGITPITINGNVIDISDTSGLQQASDAGLDRATARAWLDINTDYTSPTVEGMLDTVYGKEPATSIAGQQQEMAKDIMALDIDSVNAAANTAGMNPKEYIKEMVIKSAGFDPEDKFWETFLNRFPSAIGSWFSGQIKELKQAMGFE